MNILNWASLFSYNVTPQDMSEFNDSLLDHQKQFLKENFFSGICGSSRISTPGGLVVDVPDALILFPDGKIGRTSVGNLSIDAADVTHKRYDRIEVEYTEADNRVGKDEDNNDVVVTKTVTASVFVNKGTPAANPTIPALTAGRISLGVVSVAANQTVLVSSDILTDERYVTQVATRTTSPSHVIPLSSVVQLPYVLDEAQVSYARYSFLASRKTDDNKFTMKMDVEFLYKESDSSWHVEWDGRGDIDIGLDFSVNNKIIECTSTAIAGANYQGELVLIEHKRVKRS